MAIVRGDAQTADFRLDVRNRPEEIAPAVAAARAWLARGGAPESLQHFVDLAIEEIVTNCIKYGYGDELEHTIAITMRMEQRVLALQIVDDGRAFDPLAAGTPDVHEGAAERRVGGLGIYMLRTLADEMTYEREDGTNRNTLVKRFECAG